MQLAEALQGVNRLFFDTAPIIYFVESNPQYFDLVQTIFTRVDNNLLTAVTSPVTLAECLIVPLRTGATQLQQNFTDLVVNGNNTTFISINYYVSVQAAELRARYNLTLTDALQVAVALRSGCDAFLTNDSDLKRVTELRVLVLDELELT